MKTPTRFSLIRRKSLPEIDSEGLVYAHPCGAQLIHIKNGDAHRAFSVAFSTPARDDTGAAHVLEHCMFCGSEKYPLKDPFHELVKGSMYTFLNAITYRDRTAYPIASMVEKDFRNLTDVYLDTVFAPRLPARPEAFLREGWHYEVKDGAVTGIGGIVYNEMRGAYASPRRVINERLHKLLFPDTQYGFDSGGDPERIPLLTFDKLIEFRRTRYAPGNARIFVYGGADIEDIAARAEAYLAGAPKAEDYSAAMQPRAESPVYDQIYIPAGGQPYAAASFVIGDLLDDRLTCAAEILERFLLGTEGSPLRLAIRAADPGADILHHYDTSIRQTVFNITLKNSALSGRRLHGIIAECLSGAAADLEGGGQLCGLLDACVSRYEFDVREEVFARAAKGIYYNLSMLPHWLYDGDPFAAFGRRERVQNLRGAGAFFADTIRGCFVDNTHCAFIEAADETADRPPFSSFAATPRIMEELERLRLYTDAPEAEEDLKKLPSLRLGDVNIRPQAPRAAEYPLKNGVFLFDAADANGIAYVSVYIDSGNVRREHWAALGFLRRLLGRLGTARRSRGQLAAALQADLGGINTEFCAYTNTEGAKTRPMFILRAKALERNAGMIFGYIREILEETDFGAQNEIGQAARELLAEECSRLERHFTDAGHNAALSRLLMSVSARGVWEEHVNGLSFYLSLKETLRGWDWERLRWRIKAALAELLGGGLIIGATCQKPAFETVFAAAEDFCDKLANKMNIYISDKADAPVPDYENEGVVIPSEVSHVACAVDFDRAGIPYGGKMPALAGALTNCWLVPQVRLKGGAYGCSCAAERSGRLFLASFRDPHVAETLDIYNAAFEFIARFQPGRAEFERIIIGAAGRLLAPKTPADAGRRAFEMYIRGLWEEDYQREFDELLSTTPRQLRELAELIGSAAPRHFCAFGNAAKLQNGVFKKIIRIS